MNLSRFLKSVKNLLLRIPSNKSINIRNVRSWNAFAWTALHVQSTQSECCTVVADTGKTVVCVCLVITRNWNLNWPDNWNYNWNYFTNNWNWNQNYLTTEITRTEIKLHNLIEVKKYFCYWNITVLKPVSPNQENEGQNHELWGQDRSRK